MQDSKYETIVNVLAKQSIFVDAVKSELGQELLKDMLNKMDYILVKIVEEKATPEELAEFRVLKRMCTTWSTRINEYTKLYNKFKTMVKKDD